MTHNNENRVDYCAHEDALAPQFLYRQDQTEFKRRVSDETFTEFFDAELYERRSSAAPCVGNPRKFLNAKARLIKT